MYYYKGKVAVVTGSGSGIGRALAIQMAAAGAHLALCDISEGPLQATASACTGLGARVQTYLFDVANREAFTAAAARIQSDFKVVDLVFNNAGVTLISSVDHADWEELDWQLGINLGGVINGTKIFLPAMLKRGQGVLVNISSVFGWAAVAGQGFYNVAKFGVRALTECLWQELDGTGVRAVSVHPGGIATNIDKAGRFARKADVFERSRFEGVAKVLKTPPERCAHDILVGVARGKRRILTGHLSRILYWLPRLLPNHYHKVLQVLG